MNLIKIKPLEVNTPYSPMGEPSFVEISERGELWINPLRIEWVTHRKECDYDKDYQTTKEYDFVVFKLAGGDTFTIQQDIKKFLLIVKGAKQEAMEVLYG